MSKESAMTMLNNPASSTTTVTTSGGEPGLQPVPVAVEAPLESTRFAHLAKKEAELVKQRETFKKEHENLQTEKEKMREIQTKLNEFETLKVKDPVAALKYLGFSETDLFNFISAQQDTSTPEEKAARAAQKEIQNFKDEQTKKEQEAQEKRSQEVLTKFRQDISAHISGDKDKFEYCNYNGPLAEELIYETVAAVLEESKEVISIQEAAEMVEQFYEDQDKAMSSLKKRQPKPDPITEEPINNSTPSRPNTPSKTLSSKISATVASTTIPKKETPSEKRDRLIKTLGNLGQR